MLGIIYRSIFSLLRHVLPKPFTGSLTKQANVTSTRCLRGCKMYICLTKFSHYSGKCYFKCNCVLYSISSR